MSMESGMLMKLLRYLPTASGSRVYDVVLMLAVFGCLEQLLPTSPSIFPAVSQFIADDDVATLILSLAIPSATPVDSFRSFLRILTALHPLSPDAYPILYQAHQFVFETLTATPEPFSIFSNFIIHIPTLPNRLQADLHLHLVDLYSSFIKSNRFWPFHSFQWLSYFIHLARSLAVPHQNASQNRVLIALARLFQVILIFLQLDSLAPR